MEHSRYWVTSRKVIYAVLMGLSPTYYRASRHSVDIIIDKYLPGCIREWLLGHCSKTWRHIIRKKDNFWLAWRKRETHHDMGALELQQMRSATHVHERDPNCVTCVSNLTAFDYLFSFYSTIPKISAIGFSFALELEISCLILSWGLVLDIERAEWPPRWWMKEMMA